jgi:hypothetical protein
LGIVSSAVVALGKNPALSLAQMADDNPKLNRHGGRRIPGQRDAKSPHGNSRAYILARLEREGLVDWVEAILSRKISAYAVSVHLGWTKRPATLSGENSNQARRRRWDIRALIAPGPELEGDEMSADPARAELTDAQEHFLLYGPKHREDDAFADENEVLAAWAQHRARLLLGCSGGRRPWGFWKIDHPELPWRGYDRQRSILYKAGLLTEQERDELVAWWRAEFEKVQRLDDEARRKHYRWADIPHELVRQWSAERRRRGRTIRELEAVASQPESA